MELLSPIGRLILILGIFSLSHISYAYQEDQPLSDPIKEKMAVSIMEKVRCVVCKGQTVRDSDSKVAKTLRILIRERVDSGTGEEEIRQEITGMYSEWVYTDPRLTFHTLILWLAPFVAVVGFVGIFLAMRLHR